MFVSGELRCMPCWLDKSGISGSSDRGRSRVRTANGGPWEDCALYELEPDRRPEIERVAPAVGIRCDGARFSWEETGGFRDAVAAMLRYIDAENKDQL